MRFLLTSFLLTISAAAVAQNRTVGEEFVSCTVGAGGAAPLRYALYFEGINIEDRSRLYTLAEYDTGGRLVEAISGCQLTEYSQNRRVESVDGSTTRQALFSLTCQGVNAEIANWRFRQTGSCPNYGQCPPYTGGLLITGDIFGQDIDDSVRVYCHVRR